MGALSGVVIGYLVGTPAASPEVRGLVMTAGALTSRAIAAATDDSARGGRAVPIHRAA